MKKYQVTALALLTISTLLLSCASQKPSTRYAPYEFSKGEYNRRVDNFLVILDASGSMRKSYKGQKKFSLAKDIVSKLSQTIPEWGFSGGLRTFGESPWPFSKKTTLVYGMEEYSRTEFQGALESVKTVGGISPMAKAIYSASQDLKATQGNIAVIIVSDGKEIDATPVSAARAMKSEFGDRLCTHTVLVGNSSQGKALLQQIAEASECGLSVSGDAIASRDGMAGFAAGVFLAKRGMPSDRDGDGVPDALDQCPDTPRGDPVDATGCTVVAAPLDTDGDGVYDYADQCPNTPKGAKVDQRGCWVIQGVQFDTAKADIKPSSYPVLNEVVDVLRQNPSLRVEIQGHSDSTGSAAFNKMLSENRAKAVLEYFVSKGIGRNRLSATGYGPSRPVASNSTREGRALNRRVELKPLL